MFILTTILGNKYLKRIGFSSIYQALFYAFLLDLSCFAFGAALAYVLCYL